MTIILSEGITILTSRSEHTIFYGTESTTTINTIVLYPLDLGYNMHNNFYAMYSYRIVAYNQDNNCYKINGGLHTNTFMSVLMPAELYDYRAPQ